VASVALLVPCSSSLPLLSHCPLQVSLTWSQIPTTCRRLRTCREPICTPCAVLRRRSVWPGKELGRKRRAMGLSKGSPSAVPARLPANCVTPLYIFEPHLPLEFRREGNNRASSMFVCVTRSGTLLWCFIFTPALTVSPSGN
jgi:hypothetical protein